MPSRRQTIPKHRIAVALLIGRLPLVFCAHGDPAEPHFDLSSPALDWIAVIRWLGSLPDLADTAAVTRSLGLTPHPQQQFWEHGGKRELNYTIIYNDSIAPHSLVFVRYDVVDPNGYAAHRWPGDTLTAHAHLSFNTPDPSRPCLDKEMMVAAFGAPVVSVLATDGGGYTFNWRIGSHGVWRTYASANFGPDEKGCTAFISVGQATGPADLLK